MGAYLFGSNVSYRRRCKGDMRRGCKRKTKKKKSQILTRKAVVNCASALSIQFTEIQYRPWEMRSTEEIF